MRREAQPSRRCWVYNLREMVAKRDSGHEHDFYWIFLMCVFFCLCFGGHWCCLATPECVQCQEDQFEIHHEQTPEEGISWGKGWEKFAHVCVFDYEKVCLYVFLCITPVHARIYTPVCSLYTCVCVELVKECTFDWVQTAHKSGL